MTTRSEIEANTAVLDAAPQYLLMSTAGIVRAARPALTLQDHRSAAPQLDTLPKPLRDLLTTRLSSGEPTAAYQSTDRTCDSWILALHLPLPDGVFVAQIPPRADVFETVPETYAAQESSTEPTARQLLFLAGEHHSYPIFCARAVTAEIMLRPHTNRASAVHFRTLDAIVNALDFAMKEQGGLVYSFESLQLIPNNMRIVASRLEPAGGPISAIAENYKTSAAAITQRISSFISAPDSLCEQLVQHVTRLILISAAHEILGELLESGDRSAQGGDAFIASLPEEQGLLRNTDDHLLQERRKSTAQIIECASRFGRIIADIRRHMLGLDTIRVLGRVECSRLHEGSGLSATIDQLDAFHSDIRTRLEGIIRHIETVVELIEDGQRFSAP